MSTQTEASPALHGSRHPNAKEDSALPLTFSWGVPPEQMAALQHLHDVSFPIRYDHTYYKWFHLPTTFTLMAYTTEEGWERLRQGSVSERRALIKKCFPVPVPPVTAPAGKRGSKRRHQQQGTSPVGPSPAATTPTAPAGAPPPLRLLGLIAGQATYATMLRSNQMISALLSNRHNTKNEKEEWSCSGADSPSSSGEGGGSATATAGAVMVIDLDQQSLLLQQSVMGVNPVFYIGALAVDPLLRGCGLGAELLAVFSDHFLYHHAVNYATVCLHTQDLTAGPGGACSEKTKEGATTAGVVSSPTSSTTTTTSSSSSSSLTNTATAAQHGYDGGIWLHCLHSDKPLLHFYKKRGFRLTKVLVDYYEMPNKTKADAALLCCIPDHTVYASQQAPCRTPASFNPSGGGTGGGEEATGRDALSSIQTPSGGGGSSLVLDAKQRIQRQAVSFSGLVKCDTLWVGYPYFSSSNGNPTSNHNTAASRTEKQTNTTKDDDRYTLLQQVIDRVIDVELISFGEAQEFMMQQCYAVSASDRSSRAGGGRRGGTWLWWLWRPFSDGTAQEKSKEEAEEDVDGDDACPCATASLVCFACAMAIATLAAAVLWIG